MLNLHHLRVFYLTAKHLSCTKAAEQLFVTQPAITSQLKRFEDWCELKLFKKRGRNIYLTEEGRLLYEQVKGIFDWESRVEGLIEELKGLKKGVLRLGTTKAYARYFMPALISSFHSAYPGIKIHLDEGSSLEMINSLVELRNEVAVIAKAIDNPDVEFIPFSQEELVTIVPPFHPFARKGEVEVEELAKEPLIMKEQGSGTRKKVEALFSQHDLTPNILMETSNTEFIKQLVARGEGISFLVREAVGFELRDGKLAAVRIRGHAMSLDISIAYLKGQYLTRAGQAFLDLLLSMIPRKEEEAGIKSIMARMLAEWK
ncbi:MAG: LysR family transcriptional regulator [Deltaproteobacteria bacterium]|nr:MAG: LysR family transcriptional regulator [Deltaproteobacteria bacterium]HDG96573.1 LysR family transcriptional regulator [Desulfobacterales bacterium]